MIDVLIAPWEGFNPWLDGAIVLPILDVISTIL